MTRAAVEKANVKVSILQRSLIPFGAALIASGCSHQQPVAMAPPTYQSQPVPMNNAPQMGGGGGMMAGNPQGGGGGQAGQGSVYNWADVPAGQQVPIIRAVFDQGGYQLFAQSGETIVVPFVNQNMYVMRFGQTGSGMYFINDGKTPTLFVQPGASLENASAQGARWYPFPQNYQYTQPVYMGLAPSWGQFVNMGWYPGMSYYGGYYGYSPFGIGSFLPMAGLYFNIGGRPYYGWGGYNSYYRSNPNFTRMRTVYNYNSVGSSRSGSFGSGARSGGFGRNSGSGSFGSGRTMGGSGFGRNSGSGSFGSGRTSTGGGAFGSGRTSSGSGSLGSGRPAGGGGSFGGGGAPAQRPFGGGGGSFGGTTRTAPSGSFGGGSSGYRGGGSFGGGRPSSGGSFGGGSFSGSRPSGGGSFGGGRSSFGGGGGGRRR